MKRSRCIVGLAVLAAAASIAMAPSLLARGGGREGGGVGSDDGQDVGDSTSNGGKNSNNSGGKPSLTVEGTEFPRDGAEQSAIAREVLSSLAERDFRTLRDQRNRDGASPRRDGATRR